MIHTNHCLPGTIYPCGWFQLYIMEGRTDICIRIPDTNMKVYREHLMTLESELAAALDSTRRCLENLPVPEGK